MAQEKLAYIIKRFYPYFWHKFGFPVENDTELECIELVKNLRKAVWVHRIITFWHWYPFLEKNLISMISSPNIYVSYIVFMVSTTIHTLPNRLESFMTTCSLVTAVAAYVYDKGYLEFLEYSPTILMVLLERFYVEKSGRLQIWNHLQEYFTFNNYSKAYEIVEEKTEGNPFADAIYNKHFVREIHFHINSNISVSKHAEVHCQIQEVMKRFTNRKSVEGISTRNKSPQTGQPLQEDLIEKGQSTAEENPDDFNMERTALLRSEKQSVEEINKPSIIDSEDEISGGKKIEVIISNRNASLQMERTLQKDLNEQSTSEKGINDINLKQKSLFQPEKRQEINESEILDSQDSSSGGENMKAIASNLRASFQFPLVQPGKQSLQQVNESEILDSRDGSSRGENMKAIASNLNVSFQFPLFRPGKQSLQQVNESEIFDSGDSASRGTNMEDIASNQSASFQSALFHLRKQLFQEIKEPEILDSRDRSRGENMEVIVSNQSESRQKEVKQLTDSENQQNNFAEGTENNLKISSSQLEKLTLQDKNNQPKYEGETFIKKDAEFMNGKQSSPWKFDKWLHNDVKKRKRSESEKIVNGDKGTDSNRIPFFHLEKNLEGSEMKKIAEIKRNRGIYASEIEDFSSKISPPQLAEKSVQNTRKPTMSAKDQSTSTKETEDNNLELILSYSENLPPQCEKEPRTFENEQSGNRDEAIDSNCISLSELEHTSTVGVSEITRSTSAEEDMDLIIPTHSKEPIFQNWEELKRNFYANRYSMRGNTESIIPESNLSEMEQSFRENLASEQSIHVMQNDENDLSRVALSESEERTLHDDLKQIVLTEPEEKTLHDDLKQIVLSEPEEKTLHDDLKKLSASDNEQGILDKSFSVICLSEEDDTCQFETENQMEGNCSDSIQHDETGTPNRNSASRVKRRKRKAKSKSKQSKATEPDTALPVTCKQEALCALLFLIQKCNNSLETIYALLGIPRNK